MASKRRTFFYFVTATIISIILVRVFIVDSFIVQGDSMAPTIQQGDYVFVNKTAFRIDEPERKDIVVGNFRSMQDAKVIKRVVGLPTEWINVATTTVTVKETRDAVGTVLEENYTANTSLENQVHHLYRLDPFEYFLLGDNRMVSIDSRELGPVDSYHIDGEVFLRFRLSDFDFHWF